MESKEEGEGDSFACKTVSWKRILAQAHSFCLIPPPTFYIRNKSLLFHMKNIFVSLDKVGVTDLFHKQWSQGQRKVKASKMWKRFLTDEHAWCSHLKPCTEVEGTLHFQPRPCECQGGGYGSMKVVMSHHRGEPTPRDRYQVWEKAKDGSGLTTTPSFRVSVLGL